MSYLCPVYSVVHTTRHVVKLDRNMLFNNYNCNMLQKSAPESDVACRLRWYLTFWREIIKNRPFLCSNQCWQHVLMLSIDASYSNISRLYIESSYFTCGLTCTLYCQKYVDTTYMYFQNRVSCLRKAFLGAQRQVESFAFISFSPWNWCGKTWLTCTDLSTIQHFGMSWLQA